MKKKDVSLNVTFFLWSLWISLIVQKGCSLMLELGAMSSLHARIESLTWGSEGNCGPRNIKILVIEEIFFLLFEQFISIQVVYSSWVWSGIEVYALIMISLHFCHRGIFMPSWNFHAKRDLRLPGLYFSLLGMSL